MTEPSQKQTWDEVVYIEADLTHGIGYTRLSGSKKLDYICID